MNIFEGAKFGDKYLTRGGRKCVIVEPPYKVNNIYRIDYIVRGEPEIVSCNINGNVTDGDSDWDIVSRYKEHIDEEKLDKLAEDSCREDNFYHGSREDFFTEAYITGYKAGYRKKVNKVKL